MQKLTELENVTKEVKTVTETIKEDQTLHVHVRQTLPILKLLPLVFL